MNNEFSIFSVVILIVTLVAILTIGFVFSRLYKRASKEVAYVRTGLGGEKVVKDGGSLVLPVLHETIPINMNTLRIEVEKNQKDALISKDRMRVDVKADFYLRVSPNSDGISMAAQTLGTRTMRVEELKVLMESKFVDVLRSVAAEMTMTEMHEQRSDFVQKVQQSVANDLNKNGLELESVSLTGFDQTDLKYFNENNAFDAEGRARITQIIEEKRKETNDIQQENRILIEQRNLEADKQSLEVEQDKEEAKLDQEQTLSFKRQEQKAEIEKQRQQKEQEESEALIIKEKAIESAKIEMAKELETREIEKQQALAQAQIYQQQAVQTAEQEKQIALAKKSEEESAARAKAAEAEKLKTEKEEEVISVRQLAEANRRKEIEVIDAEKEAQREAVSITVEANAKREAAKSNAEAVLVEAEASASAKLIQAKADEKVLSVEAEGKKSQYEAENTLSSEQVELQKTLATLKALPEIIANSVKPLENIEGIKILQGYGSAGSLNSSGSGGNGSNVADQVTNAALNYRAHAPLVDSMLQEIGLITKGGGQLQDLLNGNSNLLNKETDGIEVANKQHVVSENNMSSVVKPEHQVDIA